MPLSARTSSNASESLLRRRSDSGTLSHTSDVAGEATFRASCFNLSNNIVGAGLLTMSWVFMKSSLFVGIALACFVCFLNAAAFVILAHCSEMSGTFSYRRMGEMAFGPVMGVIIQSTMLLYTIGSSISYIILTGDFLASSTGVFGVWAPDTLLDNRDFVLTVVCFVILVPLVCLPDLNKLRFISLASLFCIMYTLGMIVSKYIDLGDGPDIDYLELKWGFFSATPIVNVAFTCHYNATSYYRELESRSVRRFTHIVIISCSVCLFVYVTTGICGFLMFGGDTKSDILLNFANDDSLALAARLALSLVIISTYPMSFHSLRLSTLALIFDYDPTVEGCKTIEQQRTYWGTTLILLLITCIPGVLLRDIGVVLDYKGAIFGSLIVYVYPALIYMRLKQMQVSAFSVDGDPSYKSLETSQPSSAVTTSLLADSESGRINSVEEKPFSYMSLVTTANCWMLFLVVWGVVLGIMGVITTTLGVTGTLDDDSR